MVESKLVATALEYARRSGRSLGPALGHGVQGIVFTTQNQSESLATALKIHDREDGYRRERDAYLRLREHGVTRIRDCHVPILLAHDDDARILELTIVSKPFVLDFGGAYLDHPPELLEEFYSEWEREKREQYGDRWPEVRAVLRELERLDIYVLDVHPGNIALGDG